MTQIINWLSKLLQIFCRWTNWLISKSFLLQLRSPSVGSLDKPAGFRDDSWKSFWYTNLFSLWASVLFKCLEVEVVWKCVFSGTANNSWASETKQVPTCQTTGSSLTKHFISLVLRWRCLHWATARPCEKQRRALPVASVVMKRALICPDKLRELDNQRLAQCCSADQEVWFALKVYVCKRSCE